MREVFFLLVSLLIIAPVGLLLTIKTSLENVVANQPPVNQVIDDASINSNVPITSITVDIPSTGRVTDVQRFELAVEVGFPDPVTITAISFAENNSGDPAALSPANFDGSLDLGLWQINSGWWPGFGGRDALSIPLNNALAAFSIFKRQGLCAWSTYGPCKTHACGPPCYSDFMNRARAAARGN